MSTASLYCDDTITPNQHDELTLFLGCEKLSRKTSLVDMSAFGMNSILHGCHLYCVDDCHTNTYIQNIIKYDALPKYDRTNMYFVLINEKEESSKVSSIVSVNKPHYMEKLPFKPLPPKEGKKKKKKKKKGRSKRREETISYPKHVAPIIVFDESELDDVSMSVTYSSDHDWEKHSTFDIENLFGTNSENDDVHNCCAISAINVPSNVDSYFVEFSPTTIVKNDYVYVGSINSFMHMAHDKNVLCDSYIVNDATESYFERGKHGFMHLNNIKFPLYMLKILKLHLFYLPMLVTMCLADLFSYKVPMHRKWFKFKCISYLLFNALSCFKFFYGAFALSSLPAFMWASSQITTPSSKALKKSTLGR
jgi:hypothetical protein